jgi:hypothetical protein
MVKTALVIKTVYAIVAMYLLSLNPSVYDGLLWWALIASPVLARSSMIKLTAAAVVVSAASAGAVPATSVFAGALIAGYAAVQA